MARRAPRRRPRSLHAPVAPAARAGRLFVWGTNFVVIRWGLDELPPFLFAALRFGLTAVPFLFFLRRPPVAWGALAAFGLLIGVGQFALMFWALRADISPGLASLVVQSQVFFTLGLAMLRTGERLRPLQGAALALAAAGMATIAAHLDAHVTPLGLGLVLAAAFAWACSNMVVRRLGRIDMVAFVVWSSPFGALPLALLSALVEGPGAIAAALRHAGAGTWAAVAWQVVGNSLFGYAVWNALLARHPVAAVAPMALLVPVFGMVSSALLLGESLPPWKLGAAALVIAGLLLNAVASRRPAPAAAWQALHGPADRR